MEQSPYRAALAQIHDDGFGFIATGAAKVLLAGLKLNGLREGLVVELACGGGISSRMIVDGGFDVLGYDMSPDMIELARERVPEGRFEVTSLYDAELPGCVAVTGIGEAFNYRFDERAGFDSMCAVFDRVHAALVPGGILLFDVAQPGRAMPRLERTTWEGAGWVVTSETIEAPGTNMLERRITSTRAEEVDVEIHRLALYEHEAVFEALRATGFDPATLASYAEDYRFGVGHGGFYAVKV
ncbi:MAG: methyltransferase domain-containing protein [Thermoleophilaceae bacterium]|nr:methyltransferase domain-containing protein [Thermoleophilaceae bacterium]